MQSGGICGPSHGGAKNLTRQSISVRFDPARVRREVGRSPQLLQSAFAPRRRRDRSPSNSGRQFNSHSRFSMVLAEFGYFCCGWRTPSPSFEGTIRRSAGSGIAMYVARRSAIALTLPIRSSSLIVVSDRRLRSSSPIVVPDRLVTRNRDRAVTVVPAMSGRAARPPACGNDAWSRTGPDSSCELAGCMHR